MNVSAPLRDRQIAPVRRDDAAEVARLFYRAFRDGRTPTPEFIDYLERCFFDSPSCSESHGGLVHRDADGVIDSALLVVPMQVSVNGRVIMGRLMSSYMTDPARRTSGGADLVLTIRARNQDLCFSDTATPVSADHWKAVGGHVLPIQSLDFRRTFRPAGWLAKRLAQRLPGWLAAPLRLLARPIDAVLRRLMPNLVAPPASWGAPISAADLQVLAPPLVQHFAVHPVWSPAELSWLLDTAALNTIDGPLHLREVRDGKGHVAGCLIFYARPGGVARVLNVLARPRREAEVLAALMGELDALGCVAVEGMAQPFLMEALSRQRGMRFAPRGAFCISTRHADIVDAAKRGDVYFGGLMGEDWSRLVTDFRD